MRWWIVRGEVVSVRDKVENVRGELVENVRDDVENGGTGFLYLCSVTPTTSFL